MGPLVRAMGLLTVRGDVQGPTKSENGALKIQFLIIVCGIHYGSDKAKDVNYIALITKL